MNDLSIPIHFFDVYYDGSKYPGSSKCKGVKNGANCQYFAYELLRHFGLVVPDLRSSDLCEDKSSTKKVKVLQLLDLVLFNKTRDSYGAHVGVYLGNDKIIHLSKEVGYPTVWDFKDFKKRENYKVFVGAKRVTSLLPWPLAKLSSSTLIVSTGASTRLAGSRLSDTEVERISKSSRRK